MATEQERFAAAFADASSEPSTSPDAPSADTPSAPSTPQAETAPETESGKGIARDPSTGRFAGKQGSTEPVEPSSTPVPDQPQGEIDHRIPLAEHLNLRDRAQKAESELADTRKRVEMAETRIRDLAGRLQQQQQPPQQPVNLWENPEGFQQQFSDVVQNEVQQLRLENSLRFAHMQHGEVFPKAYAALIQAAQGGDEVAYLRVMRSPDQGSAIVNWYREREAIREMGTDPGAYKTKLRDELLKDPEFMAQAIAAAQAQASGANGGQPNTITEPAQPLPVSIGRMTGSSPSVGDPVLSEKERFNRAVGAIGRR